MIADKDRFSDIDLSCAQNLGVVVLCPLRLIDSFLLGAVSLPALWKSRHDQHGTHREGVQGAEVENDEGKGVVNSKVLQVTTYRVAITL